VKFDVDLYYRKYYFGWHAILVVVTTACHVYTKFAALTNARRGVYARSRYHSRSDSRAGRQRAAAARVVLCFVNIVFRNKIATSVKRKCDRSLSTIINSYVYRFLNVSRRSIVEDDSSRN